EERSKPSRPAPPPARPTARAMVWASAPQCSRLGWTAGVTELADDVNHALEIAGFVEKMVGAKLHAALPVLRVIEIRKHDHHRRRPLLLHRLQNLNATATGHGDVQHHNVGSRLLNASNGIAC